MLYLNQIGIIAIEEPEIHLHPKLQADIFDYINTLRQNNFVLITTHSDHFLARMQLRIRQRKLNIEDIGLYYFERSDEGIKISHREIDNEGRFEGGMPGFFEFNLREFEDYINSNTETNTNKDTDIASSDS